MRLTEKIYSMLIGYPMKFPLDEADKVRSIASELEAANGRRYLVFRDKRASSIKVMRIS